MHIRHLIHSEEDLKRRFGQRFLKRWHALLRLYRMKYKRMDGVNVLKVASISLAFYSAAVDGDAARGMCFDSSLYDGSMEIGGERFVVGADGDFRGALMWDAACLMLEENSLLADTAQWAYDEADRHKAYAYKAMWCDDGADADLVCSGVGVQNGAVECKALNRSVPAIPDDVMEWMINDAVSRGDAHYASFVESMVTRNIMERYHKGVFDKLSGMNSACRPGINVNGDFCVNKEVHGAGNEI